MGRRREEAADFYPEPISSLRLPLKVRHAVRALLELVVNGGGPLSAKEIAQKENLSPLSLHQILHRLSKAGVVRGQRGPSGGYILAKKPSEITLGEIMEAIEGPISLTRCSNESLPSPRCPLEGACLANPYWLVLNRKLRDLFFKVTLASFLNALGERKGANSTWTRTG